MTSGRNLRSSGTESRVHENDLLLYHNILDNQESQWQRLTYLSPSKTRHVSDVDVSYHPHVCLSSCETLDFRRPETVPGTLRRSTTFEIVDMGTLWRQYTEVGAKLSKY